MGGLPASDACNAVEGGAFLCAVGFLAFLGLLLFLSESTCLKLRASSLGRGVLAGAGSKGSAWEVVVLVSGVDWGFEREARGMRHRALSFGGRFRQPGKDDLFSFFPPRVCER